MNKFILAGLTALFLSTPVIAEDVNVTKTYGFWTVSEILGSTGNMCNARYKESDPTVTEVNIVFFGVGNKPANALLLTNSKFSVKEGDKVSLSMNFVDNNDNPLGTATAAETVSAIPPDTVIYQQMSVDIVKTFIDPETSGKMTVNFQGTDTVIDESFFANHVLPEFNTCLTKMKSNLESMKPLEPKTEHQGPATPDMDPTKHFNFSADYSVMN